MRITKFYKKPEDDIAYDKSLRARDKYPLYAIALSKKDAKEFINTRDMTKFIESTDDVSDDELTEAMEAINKNPTLRAAVLERYKLKTYVDKYTDVQQCPKVEFLMTEREHRQIVEDSDECILILSHMWWEQWASDVKGISILKKKYKDALDVLDFSMVKSLVLEDQFVNPNMYDDYGNFDCDRVMDWQYDELMIFMRMFQWSIKIKNT